MKGKKYQVNGWDYQAGFWEVLKSGRKQADFKKVAKAFSKAERFLLKQDSIGQGTEISKEVLDDKLNHYFDPNNPP